MRSEAARYTVGGQPNVPKRLDGYELNSHKHGQTCAHSCPSPPLLVQPPLGYTTYYTGITLGSMRWAAWWVAFYRGCPSVLWCAKGKKRWQVNGDILPVVEMEIFFFNRKIHKMRSNAGARMQAFRVFIWTNWLRARWQRSRDAKSHFQMALRRCAFYYWY